MIEFELLCFKPYALHLSLAEHLEPNTGSPSVFSIEIRPSALSLFHRIDDFLQNLAGLFADQHVAHLVAGRLRQVDDG